MIALMVPALVLYAIALAAIVGGISAGFQGHIGGVVTAMAVEIVAVAGLVEIGRQIYVRRRSR